MIQWFEAGKCFVLEGNHALTLFQNGLEPLSGKWSIFLWKIVDFLREFVNLPLEDGQLPSEMVNSLREMVDHSFMIDAIKCN